MKVLLVTDDRRLAGQVATGLLGARHLEREVLLEEVRTPERALKVIEEAGDVDLLVADADTAPTGGMALCRDLRAQEGLGKVVPPVLLLVARRQDRWLAEQVEADAALLKPPDPFDLTAVAEALVSRTPVPELPGLLVRERPTLAGAGAGAASLEPETGR